LANQIAERFNAAIELKEILTKALPHVSVVAGKEAHAFGSMEIQDTPRRPSISRRRSRQYWGQHERRLLVVVVWRVPFRAPCTLAVRAGQVFKMTKGKQA